MTKFSSYDDLIASSLFQTKLRELNAHLVSTLKDAGEPLVLNGNLFYRHLVPDFWIMPLVEHFDVKRRNFFQLSKLSTQLVEERVKGGHSALLVLLANPSLKFIGIDIATKLGENWASVDVYVPAAFKWLKQTFGDRVEFILGNSYVELPRLAFERPQLECDLLHLDGSKDNHLQEYLSARPFLKKDAFVILDDADLRPVRKNEWIMRKHKMLKIPDFEALGLTPNKFHYLRQANHI